MAGLIVFKSLEEAERNGYQPFDRTSNGYLVRTRTDAGWAMAVVDLTKPGKGERGQMSRPNPEMEPVDDAIVTVTHEDIDAHAAQILLQWSAEGLIEAA